MVHHMAVKHEFAGEIDEARAKGDAAVAREDRRIQPDGLRQRLAIDLGQQHIVGVDVKDVIFRIVRRVVNDRPLLHSPEANALIDPAGIERLAIDREPESPPKLRRPVDASL